MKHQLAQDHGALRTIMRDFVQALDRRDMPDIARRRIEFSQLFRSHMAREDAAVNAMRRSETPTRDLQTACEHGRAVVSLFLRYSEHLKRWTPAQVEEDWAGYRRAVIELQNALMDRMAWEEAHLHPLLPRAGDRAAA
ncbi:hypothetical protein SAMIE_1010190 [Sphingobium amiense]|uniref:Hemerythrin-like domain-containing protein n=1 Tax=Sphingobium amiense TaxID=135719 RepID=A0A494W2X9_9SPHN|nr:hemerythrin domain-containing protein [Sphingobium amiense]BBD97518.1 hypothetical protein SAMIE_1010190 [Sphingobium amiense]